MHGLEGLPGVRELGGDALCQIRVDSAILFLGLNGEGQHFLYGEVFERFCHERFGARG